MSGSEAHTQRAVAHGTDQSVKVAIVGSGLVGSSWAIVFARAGCEVALYDAAPDAAARGRAFVAGITGIKLPPA